MLSQNRRPVGLPRFLALLLLAPACILLTHASANAQAKPIPPTAAPKSSLGGQIDASSIFTDSDVNLPPLGVDADWGDFDNNGALDFVSAGRLFRNSGGSFSEVRPALIAGSLHWGDIDNDGLLDLVDENNFYLGAGDGYFSEPASLSPYHPLGWGDFDADGLLDLLVFEADYGTAPHVFGNKGHRRFDDNWPAIGPSVDNAHINQVSWADYDNDGLLDILESGTITSNDSGSAAPDGADTPQHEEPALWSFHNKGGNWFEQDNFAGDEPIDGSMSWADYDGDGRLDLLVMGRLHDDVTGLRLFHNEGSLIPVAAGLPDQAFDSASWADYDSDGWPDLLLSDQGANVTRIYHNNTAGQFDQVDSDLPAGNASWADYDDDGRIDLLLTRAHEIAHFARLYHNVSLSSNQPPDMIGNPGSVTQWGTNTVRLSWGSPPDDHTPSAALRYNLRVGTTPGGSDVYSSLADPRSGKRRVVDRGPLSSANFVLRGLDLSRTYYWSVQAIDSSFVAGPWAEERTFTTSCSHDFRDVFPSDYYFSGAIYLSCHGAISGYADNTFRPYNTATRAQLMKIVVLAHGWPLLDPTTPQFSDVPLADPFASYIATAFSRNIIAGYTDGTFHPYAQVTRGQAAKIVVLAAAWQLLNPATPHFADVPADNPFYQYVETAYSHELIDGYDDGSFRWQNTVTRGQIAKIVPLSLTEGAAKR